VRAHALERKKGTGRRGYGMDLEGVEGVVTDERGEAACAEVGNDGS